MSKSEKELRSEINKLKEKLSVLENKYLNETDSLRKENEELKYKMMFLKGVAHSPYDGILVVNPYGKKILQNQRTVDLWEIPNEVVNDPDGMKQVNHVMHMTADPEKFISEIEYLRDHPDEKSLDEVELKNGTILERYSAPVIGPDNVNYGRI